MKRTIGWTCGLAALALLALPAWAAPGDAGGGEAAVPVSCTVALESLLSPPAPFPGQERCAREDAPALEAECAGGALAVAGGCCTGEDRQACRDACAEVGCGRSATFCSGTECFCACEACPPFPGTGAPAPPEG